MSFTNDQWDLEIDEIGDVAIKEDTSTSFNCVSNNSSGNIWIGSGSTTTTAPYTISTGTSSSPYILTSPSPYFGSTISLGNDESRYSVMELPQDCMPNKVYVCGRLVTVGILGTDVQAAYAGNSKLIFSPGEVNVIAYNSRITISLDYGDHMYHYNVDPSIYKDVDSSELKLKMVSKVKQR